MRSVDIDLTNTAAARRSRATFTPALTVQRMRSEDNGTLGLAFVKAVLSIAPKAAVPRQPALGRLQKPKQTSAPPSERRMRKSMRQGQKNGIRRAAENQRTA